MVSVSEVPEVRIRGGGGCNNTIKEVVAVYRLRRQAMTGCGNVNGNGEKLAVAASFDDKFLASL